VGLKAAHGAAQASSRGIVPQLALNSPKTLTLASAHGIMLS
jgi:hypothetical protein